MKNNAFIDGQNLHMGTTKNNDPWQIDLAKFRIYLKEKYNVNRAYYFLGFVNESYQDLYDEIQEAGFILKFREHNSAMQGKKKGNVDSDIIFTIMKKLYKKDDMGNIVLVSGDGDYKMLVDFLIQENRFTKILFPDGKKASSLYNKIGTKFKLSLNRIQSKITK
jgi:uncharacterized LabA/DUF88 family protein